MVAIFEKLAPYYNSYVLALLTIGYILGELGHYLIGVTSKQTAIDIHYGDHACQQNNTAISRNMLPMQCQNVFNETSCSILQVNGTTYCEWEYNGLGIDYQIMAGPVFIVVFTIAGVFMGIAADKYNRKILLTVCTIIFAIAILLQGTVKEYWHLVLLRMVMAAGESGCNPLATGIMSDIFPENKRALVMAIFNWGIYGGYGIAFPVGHYVTESNIGNLGWRACYYGAGIFAIIVAVITGLTLKEPERTPTGTVATNKDGSKMTLWDVILKPRMILLMLAASIRHCGGMTFAYNSDLYYNSYFPDVDLGWWLFGITIGVGGIGVVIGGIVSDRIVSKMGIRSRAAVLALSQILATLPAFGSVYFEPVWALISLAISYFFAEMWFGIVFAIVVEIVPLKVRSTTIGIFLFVMNNIGGNLPILVDPVAKSIGFRGSLMIFYAGFYLVSSILFFLMIFLLDGKSPSDATETPESEKPRDFGHDNRVFNSDEIAMNGKHPNNLTNQIMLNGSIEHKKPRTLEISQPVESSRL